MSGKVLLVNSHVSEETLKGMRQNFPDVVRVHRSEHVKINRAFVIDPDALTTQDLRTGEIRKPFAT